MHSRQLIQLINPSTLAEIGWSLPLTGKLSAPVKAPEILSALYGDVGRKKNVLDYLEANGETDFLEDCAAFVDLISNVRFNPREEHPAAGFFVETPSVDRAFESIFDYARSESLKRTFIHVGPKGSGKTIAQNLWLKRNNARLEEARIFWVRCDGYKLYELWTQTKGKQSELTTLENYLDLKLLYVFAKLCVGKNLSFFETLAESVVNANVEFEDPIGRYDVTKVQTRKLWDRLTEIRTDILNAEKPYKTLRPNFQYVDEVVRIGHESMRKELRRWLAASLALQAHLCAIGVRILRIADGLDNVHLTQRKWLPFYTQMMVDGGKFVGDNPGPGRLNFVAVRQRTLGDIQRGFPTNVRGAQLHVKTVDHEVVTFKRVIERRLERFRELHADKDDRIAYQILVAIARQDQDEADDAFHSNHRAYMHNRVTLARHVFYRFRQVGSSPSRLFIENQVRSLRKRNLFLNGRLFLNTEEDWPQLDQELGVCAPNLFYVDRLRASMTSMVAWWGLCRTRILQLLMLNPQIPEAVVVDYLEAWSYPRELIEFDVTVLRAFGMVDSVLQGDTFGLEISPAGELFLARSYTDVDFLYYFALDTALPEALVKEGFIIGHSNWIGRRTEYPLASISVSLVFLSILSVCDQRDQERWRQADARTRARFSAWKHPADLPFHDPARLEDLRESYLQRLNTADEIDAQAIEGFLAKIRRVVKGNKETVSDDG